jgi:hypothetical protein
MGKKRDVPKHSAQYFGYESSFGALGMNEGLKGAFTGIILG